MKLAKYREAENAVLNEIRRLVQSINQLEQVQRRDESEKLHQQLEIKLQEYVRFRKYDVRS